MKVHQKVHKMCPNCGHISKSFKDGACVCGKQVENVLFVENPMGFMESPSFYSGLTLGRRKSKK